LQPEGVSRGRVAWIVLTQGLQRVSGLIVPVVIIPYALKQIGPEQYGSWLLACALASYAAQNLGIPQVLVDDTARALRRSETAQIAQVFHHGFLILCAMGVVALALIWPFSVWAKIGSDQSGLIIAAALVCSSLALPFTAVRGLAEGLQKVHQLNLAMSVAVLVSAPVTLIALHYTASVLCLFLPAIVINVMAPAIVLWRYQASYGWLKRPFQWSKPLLVSLLLQGGWYTLMGIAWTIIYNADIWVIQQTTGLADVTPYALAFTFFSILGEPVGALVMAIRPVAAGLGDSTSRAGALYQRTMRLSIVAGLVLSGWGLLWFGVLMDLWIGKAARPDYRVALFLAGFQAVRAMLNAAAWTVAPVEGPKFLALALVGDAIVNLSASIALGMRVGPWGVAAGSLIGMLACSAWYIPRRAGRRFGVAASGKWLWAMLAVLPFWIAGFGLRPRLADFQGLGGRLGLAASMLATIALGTVIAYAAGFEGDERRWLGQNVQRIVDRVRRKSDVALK
jgi:O-antigen/teichoic acid export membrane protein